MGISPQTPFVATCRHCGDDCASDVITKGTETFCCTGCATVYEVLKDNDLLGFYRVDETAGRNRNGAEPQRYDWLEVPKLARRIIRYRDENSCHVVLELPTIHCASCVWLLERLPQLQDGVQSTTVNFSRRTATIVFDPRRVSLRRIAELLDRIGYPPHFRASDGAKEVQPDRSLLYRIGVAGFCFGNIMLLSFPEYFGLADVLGGADVECNGTPRGTGAVAGAVMGAIRYLVLLLGIPVMAYAGAGFLRSAWYALKAGRTTIDLPIALGMIALFGRSCYEIISTTGQGYMDSLAGLVFFLLIGRWFQRYGFARLRFDRDYRDYFPVAAYRENAEGAPQPVASEDLKTGDILLIRPGQLIPADGILLERPATGIDYSFVTGEAAVQEAKKGQAVFAGGRATSIALRVQVTNPPDESYLLQLWLGQGNERGEAAVAPPQSLIRAFTITIIALALGTLMYWYSVDATVAFRAATAVLIIACPCALALAAPFAYGTVQRLMARRGFYLRGPAVVERLGEVDTYVFDKTGTLTGGAATHRLRFVGRRTPFFEAVFLAMARQSVHPRSKAMADGLAQKTGTLPTVFIPRVEEIVGQGLRLEFQGREYRIGSPAFCGFPHYVSGTFAVVDGLLQFKLVKGATALRPGVAEMLDVIGGPQQRWLLSGDHPPENDCWQPYFPAAHTCFRQTPFAKRDRVEQLRRSGRKALMVGDGLNDAGALALADVGLAVNEDEARFNPACDGIVSADRLAELPRALAAARKIRRVLVLTYTLALAYNVVGLSYAISGTLSPVVAAILMPLSSLTIIVVATLGGLWVCRK